MFKPSYSGDKSVGFWQAIKRLPEKEQAELYFAGVLLKDMEETILKLLDEVMKTHIENTLEPCPFCSEELINLCQDSDSIQCEWFAECSNCFASGSLKKEKEIAVMAWNERSSK